MKKKTLKSIGAFLGVFVCIMNMYKLSTGASSNMLPYYSDVSPVVQAKRNWCWAACAEMLGKNSYPKGNRNQWDIVNYIKKGPLDQTASAEESYNAVVYAARGSKEDFYFRSSRNFYEIATTLQKDCPVEVGIDYSQDGKQKGHCVVIFAADDSKRLYYVNPADGGRHVYTYKSDWSDFFNDPTMTNTRLGFAVFEHVSTK